jgi:hypothetical protein
MRFEHNLVSTATTGSLRHWAYAAHAFIRPATVSRSNGRQVCQTCERASRAEILEIQFRSATPNFKTYLTRMGGGSWKPLSGDRTRWTLQVGENRLEARTQNLAGVEGPVVSAVVEFKPQSLEKVELQ